MRMIGGSQQCAGGHLLGRWGVKWVLVPFIVAAAFLSLLEHSVGASESYHSYSVEGSLRRGEGGAGRGSANGYTVIAEGPVLVTPMRTNPQGNWGAWLRLDLTGDVGAVLARHVQAKFEIGCQKAVPPNQVAMCTVWYHRTGDGRSAPPQMSGKWKVSDTVLGFARVGRVVNQWDRFWVEVDSPALAQWFLTDDGRDIRCSDKTCAFTVMSAGSLDAWTPGDREVF